MVTATCTFSYQSLSTGEMIADNTFSMSNQGNALKSNIFEPRKLIKKQNRERKTITEKVYEIEFEQYTIEKRKKKNEETF